MEKLSLKEIRDKYAKNKPIIISYDKKTYIGVLFLDNGLWTSFYLDQTHDYIFTNDSTINTLCNYFVIDYFEDGIQTTGDCSCEKYLVFQQGCKCGSIIPYVSSFS